MSRVTVRIPMPLRIFTGGAGEVVGEGRTAREVLDLQRRGAALIDVREQDEIATGSSRRVCAAAQGADARIGEVLRQNTVFCPRFDSYWLNTLIKRLPFRETAPAI